MCTNVNVTTPIEGSAKGPQGWTRVEAANVSFDHPQHAPFDHSLNIDFFGSEGSRMALELSPESARELIAAIAAALDQGEHEAGFRDALTGAFS